MSWLIEALIASALLMASVLAIRGPVRRAFGPQIAYALWALPLLRLVLPPMPAAWTHTAATPISRAGETIIVLVIEPFATTSAVAPLPLSSLWLSLAVLWGVGAAAFLAWHLVRHAIFCRSVLARRVALDEIAGIRVIASGGASGPLAFGIFRRYIAFPLDFAARYDSRERDLALAHELGHHLRGDLLANWAALGVLALHWYNPIAWIAFRAFRADQEMANDARVLAGRDPALRHAYACAIVKAAHPGGLGGGLSAACHLHTVNDLKGRLRMLSFNRASRRRLATGTAVISLAIVGGLGLTASGTATAAAITSRVGTTIGVDLAQDDLPPPPPPVAPAPGTVPVPPRPPVPPVPGKFDSSVDVSTTTNDGGKVIRKRVIRAHDGKVLSEDYMGDIPQVSSRVCERGPDGGDKQFVVHTKRGDKQVMIICTNRIEKAAAEGAEMAANSADIQRRAMESAMSGLRSARASIQRNTDMTPEDRKEALAGIDEGIAEMRADMAKED